MSMKHAEIVIDALAKQIIDQRVTIDQLHANYKQLATRADRLCTAVHNRRPIEEMIELADDLREVYR